MRRGYYMENQELLSLVPEQEEIYQFPKFSRDEVWELGCDMVAACSTFEGPLAVELDVSGVKVFRYYPSGTGALHEMWIERKRRTVSMLEKSSLRVYAELAAAGESAEAHYGLDSSVYAICGGGFPLRIKGGCIFGFAGVSGLAHTKDHAAIMQGLDTFFRRKGYL